MVIATITVPTSPKNCGSWRPNIVGGELVAARDAAGFTWKVRLVWWNVVSPIAVTVTL